MTALETRHTNHYCKNCLLKSKRNTKDNFGHNVLQNRYNKVLVKTERTWSNLKTRLSFSNKYEWLEYKFFTSSIDLFPTPNCLGITLFLFIVVYILVYGLKDFGSDKTTFNYGQLFFDLYICLGVLPDSWDIGTPLATIF